MRSLLIRPFKSLLQISLLLLGLAVASTSYALDLSSAKQNGWVGEQLDGYLGLVVPKPEAKTLIQSVNRKRLELYKKLAKEHGLSLDQVAQRAGQRNIGRTQKGQIVQSPNGQWVKK